VKSLIRNRDLVKQVLDFSLLQNEKIHPSDIDAVFEFDNEVLILIEVKRKGVDIPLGQRLLLERICDSWHTDKSIVLKVEHSFKDETKNIPMGMTNVSGYYKGKVWKYFDSFDGERNLVDFLNQLGVVWNCRKCKF